MSVIIPFYQDRAQLAAALTGLSLQDHPADRLEIVIGDDGSAPPLRLDPDLCTRHRIRVVRQEDLGFRAAAARNRAAAVADGEVLCFLDQDLVPEPPFVRRLTRLPALLPDAVTVGRRRHAHLASWSTRQIEAWLRGLSDGPSEIAAPTWLSDAYARTGNLLHADHTAYRFIISAVLACPAALFRELGGFAEAFTRYGGEDWEFAYRAWNSGAVLAHVPDAVAWHDGPDWAARGTVEERAVDKGHETDLLGALIPAASRPGDPDRPGGPTDVLITHDPLAEATPRSAAARFRIAVHGPGVTRADVQRVLCELEYGYGRVHVQLPNRSAVTGTAIRAERRAARYQRHFPSNDLIEDLFGSREHACA